MVACFELYSDLFTYAIVQIILCIVKNGESENGIPLEIGSSLESASFSSTFCDCDAMLVFLKSTYSNGILHIL